MASASQACRTGAKCSSGEEELGAMSLLPDSSTQIDMVWIPGGTFDMGSDTHYPEERPVHRVTVDGFWIDRSPVTNARSAVLRGDAPHDVRRAAAERAGLSRRAAASAEARLARLRAAEGSGQSQRLHQLVALPLGADWRHPYGAAPDRASTTTRSSTSRTAMPRHSRGGTEGAADRSRMGVCGARRPRGRGVRVGRRAHARRPHGQHVAGRLSAREYARRLGAHVAGRPSPPTATGCTT